MNLVVLYYKVKYLPKQYNVFISHLNFLVVDIFVVVKCSFLTLKLRGKLADFSVFLLDIGSILSQPPTLLQNFLKLERKRKMLNTSDPNTSNELVNHEPRRLEFAL